MGSSGINAEYMGTVSTVRSCLTVQT